MLELFLALLSKLFVFTGYVTQGSSFPEPLSPGEETECLARMAAGDMAARSRLIEHNLRLVAHIAKKYASPRRDSDDLISIGTVGLIKAVSTFDKDKSSTLATYASRCIENEILMSLRAEKKRAARFRFRAHRLRRGRQRHSLSEVLGPIRTRSSTRRKSPSRRSSARHRGRAHREGKDRHPLPLRARGRRCLAQRRSRSSWHLAQLRFASREEGAAEAQRILRALLQQIVSRKAAGRRQTGQ